MKKKYPYKKFDIRGVDIAVFRAHVLSVCPRPKHFCDGSYIGISGSKIGRCEHFKNGRCELVNRSMFEAKKRL